MRSSAAAVQRSSAVGIRVAESQWSHHRQRTRAFERPGGGYGDDRYLEAVAQDFGGQRITRLGMDQADQFGYCHQRFVALSIPCDQVLILKVNADSL
jgi:hypothetical protein